MTPQEINKAIAELCGWKVVESPENSEFFRCLSPSGKTMGSIHKDKPNKNSWFSFHVPNYFSDLNACFDMEKTLSGMAILAYRQLLVEITAVPFDPENEIDIRREIFHATAPQRCEAFLRTHGKWKE